MNISTKKKTYPQGCVFVQSTKLLTPSFFSVQFIPKELQIIFLTILFSSHHHLENQIWQYCNFRRLVISDSFSLIVRRLDCMLNNNTTKVVRKAGAFNA